MTLDPTTSLLQTEAPRVLQPSVWTKVVPWAAQVVVALILAQTLFFKFTYAPETQVIVADRGGRPAATAVGVVELLCVSLLLVPRTTSWQGVPVTSHSTLSVIRSRNQYATVRARVPPANSATKA